MAYGMDGWSSILDRGKRFMSSPKRPDRLWGPPSVLHNGTRALFLGVKRQGHEAELHLMPMSRRMEILYFLSVSKAWCLINQAHEQLYIYLKINVKETDCVGVESI
jgi:hypothetical protein